ncbi:MAG: MMPL family transporter [Saprospiraceae bacterium]|nr:MMPL family transporter [Saprospiraceae bacterium]
MKHNRSFPLIIDFGILLMTLLAFIQIPNIKFDHSFSRLYPTGKSEFILFEKFKETFQIHDEEHIIFICVTPKAGIFNKEFLIKLDSFTKQILQNKDVFKIYGLTQISQLYYDQNGFVSKPLININAEESWTSDSVFIFNSMEYSKTLFSIDKKSVLVSVFPNLYIPDPDYKSLLKSIEQEAQSIFSKTYHVLSKTKLESAYQLEVKKNIQRISALALLIISISLILLSRSVKTLLTSYLVIFLTIAWTFGIIGLLGGIVDYLTSLLPIILGIITLTNVVHFRNHFQNTLSEIHPFKKSFRYIGWSVLFANLTTALGFLTLSLSDIPTLNQFGQYASVGILIGYVLSYYIVSREAKSNPSTEFSFIISDKNLVSLIQYIIGKRIYIIVVFGMITGLSIFYAQKIEINGSLLNELQASNPIVQDFNFFDTAFGGSRMVELYVRNNQNKSSFNELDDLLLLDTIIQYLEDRLQVHSILSPLTMIRAAHKAYKGGNPLEYRIPETQAEVQRYISDIYQTPYGDEFKRYFKEDGKEVRISGRLKDMKLLESYNFERKLQTFIQEQGYDLKLNCVLTGESFLMDKVPKFLINNLAYGLLFSVLIMSLIGYYMLGRVKYILITLLPNIIPLILVAGLMGMLQIYLKTDTAILFSIAFGMSVDNTIHLLNRFRLEKQTQNWSTSLIKSYQHTIRPITLTTCLLCAGFASLIFSDFTSCKNMGILLTSALVSSWLTNAVLLPALLSVFVRSKTSYSNENHEVT